jgi:hypothetical protein
MFSNYNIWKYCGKYFLLIILGAYIFNTSVIFINQKSDVANLIGSALFAGLFVGTMLILKSDVTKLVKNIKKTENKENE